jgi:hypothetical protein
MALLALVNRNTQQKRTVAATLEVDNFGFWFPDDPWVGFGGAGWRGVGG